MDVGSDNFRFTLDDPELKARTMRWPKTSELHLDSLDRYTLATVPYVTTLNAGGSQNDAKLLGPLYSTAFLPATNNCVIQTKRNLIYGYMSRIALTQMNLSYRVPTVTASSGTFIGNNTIGVVINGSPPQVCTIAPGFYTSSGLASAFQTALRAVSGGLLASATVIAPTSQTVGFAAAIQTGFIVNSGSGSVFISFTRINTSAATLANSTRAFRLLGINTGGTWGSQIASQLTTLGVPNLLPTDYVDVVSQALTNYKDTKDANSSVQSPGSVLGRIWLTEDTGINGQTINGYPDPNLLGSSPLNFCKTWYNPNWSQWSPNQAINSVDITLLDMWGQPLYWTPTYQTEWSATVTVTE